MKTNEELQRDVQNAIKWEPLLNAAEIGVTAKDGVVTLSGHVNSYNKKMEAEDAAKKVTGVKALVENIEIKFTGIGTKDDAEIANEVLNALTWHWEFASKNVKVKVENGWVTLDGQLEWNYQKEAAKKSISNLAGVKGIYNNIKVESKTNDEIEKEDIINALERNWSINDEDIKVKVSGNRVTLSGNVDSYYQKDEAGRIAWNAPGVWSVDNELVIDHD
jgi:osmotically-inducible protein OsmY